MKGGIAWYVRDSRPVLPRVIDACEAVSFLLSNPATRRITYLDDRDGYEGDQVQLLKNELLELIATRLDSGARLTWQFWADATNDLVCEASRVLRWGAYCFAFDLDGFSPTEAGDVVRRLHRARLELDAETILWVEERVGMTVEFGAPHLWDGRHTPAWPPPGPR